MAKKYVGSSELMVVQLDGNMMKILLKILCYAHNSKAVISNTL